MIRHYFVAALRNMAANRLQSAIAISGLTIGITAALLIGLVVRNQLTFDHFVPGHERTYLAVSQDHLPGRPAYFSIRTPSKTAALLRLNAPDVEDAARLMLPPANTSGDAVVQLKRDQIIANERIYWADPNTFAVLPLPVFSGDLATALSRPDGIVLPRDIARKYFGRDDAVGKIIQLNGHPMMVRAVIEDLPQNGTELQSGIFASGLAPFSAFTGNKPDARHFSVVDDTYVRLKPGASIIALEHRVPAFVKQLYPPMGDNPDMPLLRLDQIPLYEGLHPGAFTRLMAVAMVGALILFIASVNFVNLLTARAARRALEVGVRKVCGAARRSLVQQFLGEAILTVFFATCLAVALAEWLLPPFNAFTNSGAVFDYWRNLSLLIFGVLALGLVAGAYPAFVLSSFRPVGVLKGLLQHSPGAVAIRNGLVVLQFAILIALVVAATVIYQQHTYATRDGLRANVNQILIMRGGCTPAFKVESRKLSGVAGISCGYSVLVQDQGVSIFDYKGKQVQLNRYPQDVGLFALYGIKPLAGSLKTSSPSGDYDANEAPALVINEAAVKRLGFASPQAAIGQTMPLWTRRPGQAHLLRHMTPIIAVVPDFSFYSVQDAVVPAFYYAAPSDDGTLSNIKLKGQQIPETLAAIDRVWAATNPGVPVSRFFLSDHMQELYVDMMLEAQSFAIFSGVAVLLACLGLLGLSIATAERRTKEIGIRKAMGATSTDVVVMLLWQFSKPVLWANLIAWPLAWWAMHYWLSGFAYHVPLSWWLFPAVGAATLLVATLTVAGQVSLVARQRPVLALRYE